MTGEVPGETSVSATVPKSVADWLDDVAAESDRSPEEVLAELVEAVRRQDAGRSSESRGGAVESSHDELDDRIEEAVDASVEKHLREHVESVVDDRIDERVGGGAEGTVVDRAILDERIDDVDARFSDLLGDVRDRVVQVKREADAKAPAGHDHPDLARLLADLEDAVTAIDEEVEAVRDRTDAGFENYEQILSYLTDSVEELSARQTTLAQALVETRKEVQALAAAETARKAAADLRRTANRHGISTAVCEDCDSKVNMALLSRARCPHCSATFTGIDPAAGFFGTDRLETGDRPALAPGDAERSDFEFGVEEIAKADSPDDDVPDVDGGGTDKTRTEDT
ncbi:MAG: hypothetical protein V5A23_04990 [Halobacteriales archaeon]